MEIANVEVKALEELAGQVNDEAAFQLSELTLAMSGGGSGDTVWA